MGDDIVIRAEGLRKKYAIGHQTERERYTALRDVVARGARGLWRKTADLARGRATLAGDAVEEFWALKDVSFKVRRGEVLGIIGRNGAGKSTLLKILSRITEPSEGRATIRGRVASLLEVGTGFHPELTGRENIYLNGAILGMTRTEIRRKFDEIVAFAEVDKFLDTPVKRYSSGMYVRLAFAVAAHLEPEILIVDEVLAVGDAEFQRKCLGKLSEVAGGGRTVLFVSHNMGAVSQLCTAALVLRAGVIDYEGSPGECISEYLSDETSSRTGVAFLNQNLETHRGSLDAYLISFRLLDDDGSTVGAIRFGESIRVRIELFSKIHLREVTVGFSIIAADGRELFGTCAHDGGVTKSFSAGRTLLECRLHPMILVPGRYYIRAAIFGLGHVYHHVDEVLSFNVESAPHAAFAAPRDHYVGDVYLPFRWLVLSLASDSDPDTANLSAR